MAHKIKILVTLCFCAISLGNCSDGGIDISSQNDTGLVSSAHPLATEAGLKILKAGGNAFDAAVATAAMLNVVEPMMSGIGGYGTILVYDARKDQVRFLDSSGKIPVNVDSDVYRAPTPDYMKNRRGPKAVSTPGNVNAWAAMSYQYGRMTWSDLFTTAIATAENGFVVSSRLARMIRSAYDSFPEHAKAFYGINGEPLKEGQTLIQKDLANSLRMIAKQGKAAVYGGEIGKAIHAEMQRTGGFLALEDLLWDKAEWWEPIKIEYNGYEVYAASPPANAFPSLVRLGMMEQFSAKKLAHNSTEYLHLYAEVTKHAFWGRLKYAGDPDITPPPLDMLLSENYWKEETGKIDPASASRFVPPGVIPSQGENTTHFVVADRWGNIVSATQTLGNGFGSRIMPEGTGIWLNNSLAYCTFEPKGNPMDAHPGRRKLSGDCPTIIMKDGKPWAALGTPGGHTIGQTVPQMVMNLIDYGMDMQEAITAPRISFFEPDSLAVENAISEEIFEELKSMGHYVARRRGLGNAHGLRIFYGETGRIASFKGGADPRGEGTAKTYKQ